MAKAAVCGPDQGGSRSVEGCGVSMSGSKTSTAHEFIPERACHSAWFLLRRWRGAGVVEAASAPVRGVQWKPFFPFPCLRAGRMGVVEAACRRTEVVCDGAWGRLPCRGVALR